MNPVLQAALNFYDAGVSVVPASVDGSKAPIGSWKKYQSERASREQLIQWFGDGHLGIGIVTGAISGNLEMLELEGRAVSSGLLEEAKEIAFNSGLSHIWEAISTGYVEATPSGGVHFLYQVIDEPISGNLKLARRPGEGDSVEVLAETRGEGGFVVTAPSSGSTHPSGNAWILLKGSPATIAALSMEERNAIHAVFRSLDSMPVKESIELALKTPKNSDQLKPGDDYNNKANWKEILEPKGWKIVFTSGGVTYWRRPGKDIGISATTGRNDGDNLYVFTTSSTFEAEKPYSKFAAYTHLEFDGDYSRAASSLRSQGFGSSLSSLPSNPLTASSTPLLQLVPKVNDEEEIESSWKPVDLLQFFDGSYETPVTSILTRTDDKSLIYAGRVHSFYGESESGKSWLAQIAVAEQLKQFRKVVYIDFESDAADLVFRLGSLGVSQAEILQNFTYIRPDAARDHDDPYWQNLLKPNSSSLVIIDGVTEALTMWGGETKDNDAITRWMRLFPRAIAQQSGAAVISIDHVTKDKETRGRFAIGGQAKLATIDGAAYLIEPIEVLAPGRTGTLTVRVTKDRPGFVRKIAGMYRKSDRTQEAAVITIDSVSMPMKVVIAPPLLEDEALAAKLMQLDSDIIDFIDNNPASTKSKAVHGIKGHDDKSLLTRIDELIEDGILENQGNNRSYILYITDEGRAKFGRPNAVIFQLPTSK
jgi:hypothetical protein